MKFSSLVPSVAVLVCSSLLVAQPAWASPIDVNFGEMNFGAAADGEQAAAIGTNATIGFTHRYDDVFVGVDAIATVIDIQNIDSDDDQTDGADLLLDAFDRNSSTGKEIDLDIDVFGNSGSSPPEAQTGFVTFRIDFVTADTTSAVILRNIGIRVEDIDAQQFVSFNEISTYELSSTPATKLTVTSSGGTYEFKEPLGVDSASSDQENWVAVEYSAASSITMTFGARQAGTAGFDVVFNDTTWSSTPTRVITSSSTQGFPWVGAQSISCPAPNPWVKEQLGFASSVNPVLFSAENTIGKTITQSSFDSLKSSGVVFDTVSKKVSTATETLPIYGCKDKLLSGKVNQPIQFIAGGYTLQSDAHGYINTSDLKWHDTNGVTLYTNTAAFMHAIKFTKTGKYVVVLTEQPDTSSGLIPTYGVRSIRFVININ